MINDNIAQIWTTLSRRVLASVLMDNGAIFAVMEIVKHNKYWFSPEERIIYDAALGCVEADTPPTVEAIAGRLNGNVPAGRLQEIAGLFNDEDNRNLVYNTEQMRDLGILVKVKDIGKTLNTVDKVADLEKAIGAAATELNGVYADKSDRDGSGKAVDEAAWQMVDNFTGISIPTSLDWFDQQAGGLWPGMNYWIAAAYKSGKSTLMRNMVLAAAAAGFPVSVYCAEGTREMFALDCQAMIATKFMLDRGVDRSQCRLSGLAIIRNWTKHQNQPVFTEDEYYAIVNARTRWNELPIQTHDTRDGIRDLTTLHYSIKRDKMKHGVKAAFMDYSQLFGSSGTLFERQSNTALKIQEIAQNESIAMVALAQKNEASILDGGNKYSVGIKGGGDASAAADFLLVPTIDPDSNFVIKVALKHSRHTPTAEGSHIIIPASGLIIGDL